MIRQVTCHLGQENGNFMIRISTVSIRITHFLILQTLLPLLTKMSIWLWLLLSIMLWKSEKRGLFRQVTGQKTNFFACELSEKCLNLWFSWVWMDFSIINHAQKLTLIISENHALKDWAKGIILAGNRPKYTIFHVWENKYMT